MKTYYMALLLGMMGMPSLTHAQGTTPTPQQTKAEDENLMHKTIDLRHTCTGLFPDPNLSSEDACMQLGSILEQLKQRGWCLQPENEPYGNRDWSYCPGSKEYALAQQGIWVPSKHTGWDVGPFYPNDKINDVEDILLEAYYVDIFHPSLLDYSFRLRLKGNQLKLSLGLNSEAPFIMVTMGDYTLKIPNTSEDHSNFIDYLSGKEIPAFIHAFTTAPYMQVHLNDETYKLTLLGAKDAMDRFTHMVKTFNKTHQHKPLPPPFND